MEETEEMEDQVVGACLCGTVRFSVAFPTAFCAHCHCTMCQRSHGAGYVTWFSVARDQLRFESGESQLVRFSSSDHGVRSFCGRCGSSLFCESGHRPDHIDVVLASVSGPLDREPQAHAYFGDRAPWIRVDDGLPRLGGVTGLEPLGPGPA